MTRDRHEVSTNQRTQQPLVVAARNTLAVTAPLMCTLGHIATTRQLADCGISAFRITTAVQAGRVVRLRRGIYGCPHLPEPTARAVRVAGALTCVSILREAGVWAGNSRTVHVQLAPGTARPRLPDITPHWEHPRFPMETRWRASPLQAMWRAIHCLDGENAVAALESALHLGLHPGLRAEHGSRGPSGRKLRRARC
jgi:Transcriptional regulator, AbiEi antitoxin